MQRTQPRTLIDRVVWQSIEHPLPTAVQFVLATIVILGVGIVRVSFLPDTLPWLLFIPATIGIALVTGRGPGLYAAALSTLTGIVSIGSKRQPFWLLETQWTAALLFLIVMIGLVFVIAALRDSMRHARSLNIELVESEARAREREAFLSGVLASSTDCIKVLDLKGRLTFMSEGGQHVMEVSDFNAIAGCPWPDFWRGQGNDEATAALDAARQGQSSSFISKAETFAGTPKWWHVAVSPIHGASGKPDRILSVSRDISDVRAREEERDRFVRLAENSADFIGMARTDGRVFYLNDAACRLVGLTQVDYETLTIKDFFPPDQVDTVLNKILPAVDRDGYWSGEMPFRHFVTGETIPVLYSVFPITDAIGTLIGYGTVTRDYRAFKRAETDLRFLNGELAHRLKNVLAVVQSIAQQTLRSATDTASASRALGSRLVALGAATDVLTNGSWRSADLREVVTRALAPHGQIGERISLSGPSVLLKPDVTVALALALHELATNAAKYGALSNNQGTVRLEWSIEGRGKDATFRMIWQETGGPAVSPPQCKGFGSTLIERSLRSYFGGTAATDYRPDGLVFELVAQLEDAAESIGN